MAARVCLGVDVGGTKLALGLVTETGAVLARDVQEMAAGEGVRSPAAVAAAAARFVRSAGAEPCVAGISLAAALDGAGVVAFAPNLPGWQGAHPAEAVERAVGVRARVLYDGHAALTGEAWLGAAREAQAAAMLILGTGVGGAFMSGGRVVPGRDGLAGVFGFLQVPDGGGGAPSPLESRVSGPALGARLTARRGRPATSLDLFAGAARGDRAAQAVLEEALEDLGLGLAMVASALNPDVILLGGGLGEVFARHASVLEAAIRRRAQPVSAQALAVRAAALGNDAGWLGAARFALSARG